MDVQSALLALHFLKKKIYDQPLCPLGHKEVQWGEELPSVHSRTALKCFSGS